MKRIYQIFFVFLLLGVSGCASPNVAPTATLEATAIVDASAPTATFVPPPTMVAVTETADVLALTFDQKFEATECPAGSADGSVCWNISGTAKDAVLGEVTMSRTAVFNMAGKKDDNQCVSAFTHGKLMIGAERVTYNALGIYCPATSTSTYTYIITGGTGIYTHAQGSGTINVPAPSSSSSGTETWSGTVLK